MLGTVTRFQQAFDAMNASIISDHAIRPRASFVHEQTVASLFGDAWSVFSTNFWTIVLCYSVAILPVQVAFVIAALAGRPVLTIALEAIAVFLSFIPFAATTIAISDVCLGNQPSIKRAYGKIFRGELYLRLIWTGLLAAVCMFIAAFALVVPAIILMLRWQFWAIVCALEGRSGMSALKRSSELTKGNVLRAFGIQTLAITAMFGIVLVAYVLFFICVLIGMAIKTPAAIDVMVAVGAIAYIGGLAVASAFAFVVTTLLYYDLRARKESYDLSMLSEELRR